MNPVNKELVSVSVLILAEGLNELRLTHICSKGNSFKLVDKIISPLLTVGHCILLDWFPELLYFTKADCLNMMVKRNADTKLIDN